MKILVLFVKYIQVLPLQLKVTGAKQALIYYMSPLNEYVEKSSFKLEGWEEMFDYAQNAVAGIKFDLKKFYHEIDIADSFQQFFGFAYPMKDGEDPSSFVWQTMPYGYTRAPFIARQIMKPLISRWRSLGGLVVVFYDDGLIVSNSKSQLEKLSLQVHCDLLRAGLLPGIDKCIWEPTEVINWNGLTFNFKLQTIAILEKRVEKIMANIQDLLVAWPYVTFRQVAQCVGRILSIFPVFRGITQTRTRMLQTIVNVRNYKNLSWDKIVVVDYMPLLSLAHDELLFWRNYIPQANCRQFCEPWAPWVAWVDASDIAVGSLAVKLPQQTHGKSVLTADNLLLNARGKLQPMHNCATLQVDALPWAHIPKIWVRDVHDLPLQVAEEQIVCHRNLDYDERVKDSNERELIAAHHLLLSGVRQFRGSTVTLYSDNSNAALILEKGSPKPRLQFYASAISDICVENNIKLRPVWIPRDLNNVADLLSKTLQWDDYQVTVEFFQLICDTVGEKPQVDCFADTRNAKASVFYSLTYCPNTSAVDAFSLRWDPKVLHWIFVKPSLVLKAVSHLRISCARALLLVPQWKNSFYYPVLQNMRRTKVVKKVLVFSGRNAFIQGSDPSSYFGPDFKANVEVWYIDFSE